jgi:hypothetical protein
VLVEAAGLLTTTAGGTAVGVLQGKPNAAFDLVAHIPVLDHTFVDADIPVGYYGLIGNPMVGMHHVLRPLPRLWVSLGGAFGFPLINNTAAETFAQATAWWDAERFLAFKMPFAARLGIEGHAGLVEIRAQLEPVWSVSIASCAATIAVNPQGCTDGRDNHFFAFQHAVEIQVGHAIGGGLRYQGVLVGTDTVSLVGSDQSAFGGTNTIDRYQGTLEPFLRFYRDPGFFRVGLLLPLDKPLGAPFDHAWGVRAAAGFNLD